MYIMNMSKLDSAVDRAAEQIAMKQYGLSMEELTVAQQREIADEAYDLCMYCMAKSRGEDC